MKKRINYTTGILSILILLNYCSNNYFGTALSRAGVIAPTEVVETPIETPTGGDPTLDYFQVEATWTQPSQAGAIWPEIVFVADTSGSMEDEKDALVNALGGWLTNLQGQGIENFCVGVMESSYTSTNAGRLRAASGNSKCLCTEDGLSVADIVDKFEENINTLNFAGGAGEAGIYSLDQALNNPDKLAANQADGCFRLDYALVPIIFSDEQDMGITPDTNTCNVNAMGTTSDGDSVAMNTVVFDNSASPTLDAGYVTSPKTASNYVNGSCDEAKIRLQYYSEATPQGDGKYHLAVSPQSVSADVFEYNDSLPTYGTAITYNTTTFPTFAGTESKGWGLLEFADAMGQDTANLATTSDATAFNSQMNNIADALVDTISFIFSFKLPSAVCDGEEDSVAVTVNGEAVSDSSWSLNSAGTKVTFNSSFDWEAHGGASAPVVITYSRCE